MGYQPDATGPYGGYAALMQTGPGDSTAGKGGKPYLLQTGFDNTKLADLTDLGYSTKTLRSDSDSRLAPAFNIQLRSDSGFQGSLVYEPVYNKDVTGAEPGLNKWQTWDLNSRNAIWYATRNVTDANGNTVFAANTYHRYGAYLDAFDANPGKYANLRVNPGGAGINIALGQAGYSASTSNLVAEVDGVNLGSSTQATRTYDFESLGDCTTFDQSSKTLSLTKDCSTTASQQMGDGWTFDGNGHTLTAVEDSTSPNFPGAVVASAVGDTSAASLDVRDLTIKGQFSGSNSGGGLSGIHFDHAGGSVTNTTVDRITHGNGAQEGQGIWATNGDATAPLASLDLSGVTVTNYQKTGIKVVGNVDVTATGLDIGTAGTPGGAQLTTIGANGMSLVTGAHGSVTDSHLTANRYSSDDPASSNPGPAAESTAMLLFDSGSVTASRLSVDGVDGDAGIAVSPGAATSLVVACSSLVREQGPNNTADPEVGIGVDNADNGDVTLNSVTFSGWRTNVVGTVITGSDPSCGTSVTATATPTTVSYGNKVKVSGTATDADGNPLVGTVELQRKQYDESTFAQVEYGTTAADGSYVLKDQTQANSTYRVVFSAPGKTSSTSPEVKVTVLQRLTATISPTTVRSGGMVTATGKVSPPSGGRIILQRKIGSGGWQNVASTSVISPKGEFTITWKATGSGTVSLRVATTSRKSYGSSHSLATAVTITK